MPSVVVDMLVRGSYGAWAFVGGLWLFTMGVVLSHQRGARASAVRVIALLCLTSATSAAGLAVATAVAIPRLRWITTPDDPLLVPKGDTWRRLRGPAVPVMAKGEPDLAIPTIDADGRWVLFGLLANKAVPGLSPAPQAAPSAGAPRICATDGEACRAWPSAWPSPTQGQPAGELTWMKSDPLSALAFDVESGRYLSSLGAREDAEQKLELIGRVSNDPPRDIVSSLFVLRRIVATEGIGEPGSSVRSWLPSGRLQAMRVVSAPAAGAYVFQVQRSDVSLAAGPMALLLFARPLLVAAALGLPLALLAYILSPIMLSVWLRRRSASRRTLARSITLTPVPSDSGTLDDAILCSVTDAADLDDARFRQGAVVSVGFAGHDGARIRSRSWFELPTIDPHEPVARFHADPDLTPSPKQRGGLIVPADALCFWSAARVFLTHRLRPLALCAAGVSVAAPGLVAVVSLLWAR